MEKNSKKSIELLHHFQCMFCKKWWSVGDAPEEKEKWWCPWCGKENKYS
ncbi:MAG: hypothetical protein WCT19_02560 [Candidatus Paceibacterota bacterium]|jgi:hypothetical protein